MADSTRPCLDFKTFRDDGYLQEVNRLFFHPLGLALALHVENLDIEAGVLRIWDYRDDPEGINFAAGVDLVEMADRVRAIRKARMDARLKALGYWEQPVLHPVGQPL